MRTRSINSLLIIIRDEIERRDVIATGICLIILELYNDTITSEEYRKLINYMHNNRPKRGIHYDKQYSKSLYWWPQGAKEPRIKWLNSKIK